MSEPSLIVAATELDYDAELVFRWRGEPFTGVGYEEHPVRSEVTYVDGHQTGPARDFYASGRLSAETWYHDGTPHGWNRTYAEDGTVRTEELYEFGMPISPTTGYAVDPTHQSLLDRLRAELHGWPAVR